METTRRYKHITATTNDGAVSGCPATLHSVIVGVALSSGTVKLYDCLLESDVAAGNLVATIALDVARPFPFGCRFDTGITAIVSGNTDVTVIWE